MAEQPNEIERDIEASRDRLRQNLQALESKVKETTNWRTYVDRYPLAAVGVAVGCGVVLARLVPVSEIASRAGRTASSASASFSTANVSPEPKRSGPPSHLQRMGGALISIAMQRLQDTIEELVPGFAQEYERRGQQGTGPQRSGYEPGPEHKSYAGMEM